MASPGPFELTKLSAQISVLMADRSDGGGKNDAIRKSYQNLGTWKTAQNLVKHRGWRGLYSGFHLHLREFYGQHAIEGILTRRSPRFDWYRHLLCHI
jgi:hypothetical protein